MKHKFLVFALVLTLLLPCLGGSVAYGAEYPDNLPALPQIENSKCVVYHSYDSDYCLAVIVDVPVNDIVVAVDSDFEKLYMYSDTTTFSYKLFKSESNEWVLQSSSNNLNRGSDNPTFLGYGYGISLIYSESDVYNIDTAELVFRKPSVPLGIPRETLTQAITQENPLNQILTLLPMVTVLLVGYLGLRKGLAIFRTTLKKA